ncbi:hypothetical protein SCHPADRAFT_859096 [Schizopora paradoxa]|uniref:BTB domain-containing protein n=1 Tax=Schizopora paradoxa TaxID=27342 RepID=A0A0H2R994_9AGAM|nr:hypothetical protein SCHPADRAFT_859096 [Schizopora paradoxa]
MEPTRHEALWFSTGDLVLSTNTYLFKVHKEILALQSSVFRDMIEFPTVDISVEDARLVGHENGAGSAPDRDEGLPLVALSGDEGKDVAHLLKAIYYREYYDRDNDETPLETIIALLVLGNKYDFKHICKEVTKQLSRHYPNTLDGFDDVDGDGHHSYLFGKLRYLCHVPLLEACHTANVAVLLPSLYYACAGFKLAWSYEQVDEIGGLHADCLRTLLIGKSGLDLALHKFIASLPDEFRNISCSFCKVDAYISQLHQQLEDYNSYLSSNTGHRLSRAVLENGCQKCSAKFVARIDAKREKIWEKIPSYFGFPGWDELQERSEENA